MLSDTEITEIDAEVAHLPTPAAAAIDALKIVQEHRGWVSDGSIKAIAKHLNMSAAELDGIATFYSMIFRKPVGNKVILLCDSISCWIKDCDGLQKKITQQLGIKAGETTADNEYTLIPVTCLGACDKAPVLMVGDDLHENIDEKYLQALFSNRPVEDE
ncbi:MAG: NADH-quinone oxidoreductase subunit NuoE [Cycloclasticus sp.]|nr:MAG: NADH-quinone oxidoreductase subunit NuoE [Cycloclasticus sp.]